MTVNDSLSALYVNDIYMSTNGITARDRTITNAKRDFEQKVIDNPGSCVDAERNGSIQRFLVTQSDVAYKCTVTAYPGEDLFPGDVLSFYGEHWIVQQTKVTNVIQTVATAWLCNYKFRFQAFSSEIHERWGVLDSGVYSTSKTSDSTIATLDMQYKIYLPGDDITKLIHEDQRLATDKWVDKNGDPILLTYAVTGRDRVSKSYGDGAHLLILNARSSSYNAEKDNYEEMICDYIDDEPQNITPQPVLKITGRDYIRIGSSRLYKADLELLGENIGPAPLAELKWNLDAAESIYLHDADDGVSIIVPDDYKLDGAVINLTVAHKGNKFAQDDMRIEVVP